MASTAAMLRHSSSKLNFFPQYIVKLHLDAKKRTISRIGWMNPSNVIQFQRLHHTSTMNDAIRQHNVGVSSRFDQDPTSEINSTYSLLWAKLVWDIGRCIWKLPSAIWSLSKQEEKTIEKVEDEIEDVAKKVEKGANIVETTAKKVEDVARVVEEDANKVENLIEKFEKTKKNVEDKIDDTGRHIGKSKDARDIAEQKDDSMKTITHDDPILRSLIMCSFLHKLVRMKHSGALCNKLNTSTLYV